MVYIYQGDPWVYIYKGVPLRGAIIYIRGIYMACAGFIRGPPMDLIYIGVYICRGDPCGT
jgi:hypothetical protein